MHYLASTYPKHIIIKWSNRYEHLIWMLKSTSLHDMYVRIRIILTLDGKRGTVGNSINRIIIGCALSTYIPITVRSNYPTRYTMGNRPPIAVI